jgi:hypothetical protein
VIFWATLPTLEGVSTGAKIGTFLGLIVILAQAVGAALAMVTSGTQLRWRPTGPVTG